jgi:hypothetical protein
MSITMTQPHDSRPVALVPVEKTRAEGSRTLLQPLIVLGIILLIGLGLRGWRMSFPLQQDEYGPLYAVAQREGLPPGWMPTEDYPLKPVGSWQEVRERSVLPYGIVNPLPVYNWLLYTVIQVCPITEWALRLPALLAGLGCIAAVYSLCRRLLGAEVALVAALLVAVDPLQIEVSVLARPYALGNLACVLSFWGLLGLLYGRSTASRGAAAVLYALSLSAIGYIYPILLRVLVAQVGMVAYWWLGRPREEAALATLPQDAMPPLNKDAWAFNRAPQRTLGQLLLWLVSGVVGLALVLPELDYFQQIWQFSKAHQDYIFDAEPRVLTNFLQLNSTFLVALLAVSLATLAMKQLSGSGETMVAADGTEATSETKVEPPAGTTTAEPVELPPQPENPDLLWLGRCWLFLPQMLFMILGYLLQLNSTRYFTYVTLGGVILLAYWATRERVRDVRLGVVGMVALVMFLWGFTDWSKGVGLLSSQSGAITVEMLNKTESWRPGSDVVLYRSGSLEADFLPNGIPAANRAHVEAALAAPITTLYASKVSRPYILLSLSQKRNDREKTWLANYYDPSTYYTEELARQIAQYQRFWICSGEWSRRAFLASVIPWLANTQHWDLLVSRRREEPERYFLVASGTHPEDFVTGLSDAREQDFTGAVLVRRVAPSGGFSLGALGATMLPNSHLTVPVWLVTQYPTPHLTKPPSAGGVTEVSEGR